MGVRRTRNGAGLTPGVTYVVLGLVLYALTPGALARSSQPVRATKGMVVSANGRASEIGADILRRGGNAVDAAIATAFALAVTHPTAGNIGGGGFLVFRPAKGEPTAYDFREMAPAGASPTMFMKDGVYRPECPPPEPPRRRRPRHRRGLVPRVGRARAAAMATVDRAGHTVGPRRISGHDRSGAFARGRAGPNGAVSGVGRAVFEGRRPVRAG